MPSKKQQGKKQSRKMAEQIYDMIMSQIAPDLMLENIPTLDKKYASETDAEHKERMRRYKLAYKEFDTKLAEFMGKIKQETRSSKRAAMKKKEKKARQAEQEKLQNLEQAFN